MIEVIGFDHVVLRCVDVETTLAWYRDRLGLAPVRVDEWRAGEAPFPSVRIDEGTIIDLIPAYAGEIVDGTLADGRIDHLCLVVSERGVEEVLGDDGFTVVDGPGPRFGARGVAMAVLRQGPRRARGRTALLPGLNATQAVSGPSACRRSTSAIAARDFASQSSVCWPTRRTHHARASARDRATPARRGCRAHVVRADATGS